jgi:hypothetical protein
MAADAQNFFRRGIEQDDAFLVIQNNEPRSDAVDDTFMQDLQFIQIELGFFEFGPAFLVCSARKPLK